MLETALVWLEEELLEGADALVQRFGDVGFAVEEDAVEDEVAEFAGSVFERVVDELAVKEGRAVIALEGLVVGHGKV